MWPKIDLRKRVKEEFARGSPRRGPVRRIGVWERGDIKPGTLPRGRGQRGAVLGVQPAGLPASHAPKLFAGAEEDTALVERRLGARIKRLSLAKSFVRLIYKL